MIPQPLHPAVVHFPIVFAVLLPLVAVVALVAIRRGVDPRRGWLPVVALTLLLSGSAWVALETGEADEEAVEEVVPEAAIHEHEEAAELFLWASVVTLLLAGAGLLQGRAGGAARAAGAVAAVVVLGLGYRVGHAGGELVYQYDAASAYAASPTRAAQGTRDERAGQERERDHDDRDRDEAGRP